MKKMLVLIAAAFLCLCGFTPEDNGAESRRVPVIMYHSVSRTNVGEYVVSPECLRNDFEYLRDKGYSAVFVRDIIDFCDGLSDLPDKPVILTFDDGFYNNLYYADSIAKECGMKIVVSVVGSYIAKEQGERKRSPVYSYLNLNELKSLYDGGRAEIANHTYDMHHSSPRKGVRKKYGESEDEYRNAIIADSDKCRNLIEKTCGNKVEVFTYPFGCYSKDTNKILEELGYIAILTCKGGINTFYKGSRAGLERIMRYNRSGYLSTNDFFRKIGL